MASEAFYVPFDKITPLPTPAGPSAIYIWQAFPWMKYFITPWGKKVVLSAAVGTAHLLSSEEK